MWNFDESWFFNLEFPGQKLVCSRISRSNVTNLKVLEGFFWNSLMARCLCQMQPLVPTGVRFYMKLGSGQCQYSEQGTPGSYVSPRIALYSRVSFFQQPQHTAIYGVGHSEQGTENCIPCLKFSTPHKCAKLHVQVLFQVGYLKQNTLLYEVGHSD